MQLLPCSCLDRKYSHSIINASSFMDISKSKQETSCTIPSAIAYIFHFNSIENIFLF